jgi:hypothetical protein
MKKTALAIFIALTIGSTGILSAKPNLEMGDGAAKLAKMAGEKSPYYRAKKEAFPKDYFLVSQNLPFLVGISLYHPNSDSLKLNKEQLDKIIKLRDKTVPAAAKAAKMIKSVETELAKAILEEKKKPEEIADLVSRISEMRTALTTAHLSCIHDIQQILSDEQYGQLLKLTKPSIPST